MIRLTRFASSHFLRAFFSVMLSLCLILSSSALPSTSVSARTPERPSPPLSHQIGMALTGAEYSLARGASLSARWLAMVMRALGLAVAMPQGTPPNLDFMRTNRPSQPDASSAVNNYPPSGYTDPIPTTTANFNSYYTQLTLAKNATGIAGSKPLQSVDPTAGDAVAGNISVNLDSGNFNFAAPVLSLAGRAGLNLNLALSYNSRV